MSNSRNRKTQTTTKEEQQVEELLRAAQDDMLLSLSVDSHISHLSDVDRRFQALKSKSKTKTKPAPVSSVHGPAKSKSESGESVRSVQVDEQLKAVLGDDLSARFAALKASSSLPIPSSSAVIINHGEEEEEEEEEDEVEKLMRWAKDAARLDPSPPSDDEE